MNLIRDMLSKIEEDHQAKLKQLDSIKVQQDSFFVDQNTGQSLINDKQTEPTLFDPFQLNEDKITNIEKLPKNSLSLDQKERLAFEQEQTERLKNEKLLIISPTDSTPKSSHITDLTNSLINSNLNTMSNVSSIKPSLNSNQLPCTFQNNSLANPFLVNKNKSIDFGPLNSIGVPNIGVAKTAQTLNSLKSQSQLMNNCQQTNNNRIGPANLVGLNNSLLNSNLQSTNTTTKQLSKNELEEFLN